MAQPDPGAHPKTADANSPEAEGQHHTYITHEIPWYVHLLWVSFWILAIGYVLINLFPAFQREIMSPP